MRFHVKERALSITDNFVIRDEMKNVAFEVRGKLIRIGDSFSIYAKSTGTEVMKVRQRVFAYTTQYEIFSNGIELASVRRRTDLQPYGDRIEVACRDGMVFHIQGSFHDWDFTIIDHYGRMLGHINKEFAFIGDSYTVDVSPGVDAPFIIAIAIILDEMKEDRKL